MISNKYFEQQKGISIFMSRSDLHPNYHEVAFNCSTCKTTFQAKSTLKDNVTIDTCSNCHPTYIGKNIFTAAKGRIEKFRSRVDAKTQILSATKKAAAAQKEINDRQKVAKK